METVQTVGDLLALMISIEDFKAAGNVFFGLFDDSDKNPKKYACSLELQNKMAEEKNISRPDYFVFSGIDSHPVVEPYGIMTKVSLRQNALVVHIFCVHYDKGDFGGLRYQLVYDMDEHLVFNDTDKEMPVTEFFEIIRNCRRDLFSCLLSSEFGYTDSEIEDMKEQYV